MNNNKMESFNGNTLQAREKVVRGIKRTDSPTIAGMRIHHNFVRSHIGLDGRTPAEAAGIDVEGPNKLKTIIQNASSDQGASLFFFFIMLILGCGPWGGGVIPHFRVAEPSFAPSGPRLGPTNPHFWRFERIFPPFRILTCASTLL